MGRAPFNGRQVVSAGSPLFTLQGDDQAKVEAGFPLSQLSTFPISSGSVPKPGGAEWLNDSVLSLSIVLVVACCYRICWDLGLCHIEQKEQKETPPLFVGNRPEEP